MADTLIGNTLAGRFVLEDILGTGATGSVYRAHQTSVDRMVAVKTLHPFLQERDDFKARFEIEAKAIARLNHPNCITLYDFGYDTDFDVFYMAVEYIRGEQLGDMMQNDIPIEDVLSISYQVADALEHAHREGILHRDLKPENIMIQAIPETGRLTVKVLDFGLARLYEAAVDDDDDEPPSGRYKQITEAGQVYGTPAYMSPEQCRGKSELTPATDIYALGTMMFELLEGRLPFFSKSTAELIMMQMTDEPPKMGRIDVPPDVRDMIHRMMAKDPLKRPQSAKEVLVTLMPFVRLDASQEFRILPNASGEFAKLSSDQIRSMAQSAPIGPPTTEDRPRVATLELSSDELKSARGGSAIPVVMIVFLVVVALAGGTMMLVREPPGVAVTSPAVVDSAAAAVADSPEEVVEDVESAVPVEVAKNGDKPDRHKKPRKRLRSKKAASDSPAEPASTPDEGTAPSTNEADRPKTLKLTY